jgi:hypothetical protein
VEPGETDFRQLDNSCYHDYIRTMQQTLGTIFLYAGLICWLAGLFGLVLLVPGFFVGMVQGALGGPYLFFWLGGHRHGRSHNILLQTVKTILALLAAAAIIVFLIARSA